MYNIFREGGEFDVADKKAFLAIDLKSFYASVECVERGLDPMKTNLAVCDVSRTEKTICLAVSPSLKAYGIPGRARLFELISAVKAANAERKRRAPYGRLNGASYNADELESNPTLAIDYIAAPPRMALYMEYSARIYDIYLKYVAPEDIHVYSVDEVFIDATHYLGSRKMTAHEFVKAIIRDVLEQTGITATAGIGTNLYLCKVAMDIVAKHVEADADGVRIAQLDEHSYREKLWAHRPLRDFWRVGRGYAERLEAHGLYTMGDIARASLTEGHDGYGEELLYKLFGINAELLIDHAWGYEPCTMADIKEYKPTSNSLGSGQVLHCAYAFDKARLIAREMIDTLSLDLVEKGLLTDQIVINIGYDVDSLKDESYSGEVATDYYGRRVPKGAHGSINLEDATSSTKELTHAALTLFDRITDRSLLVRRINVTLAHLVSEESHRMHGTKQMDFFSILNENNAEYERKKATRVREKRVQNAVIDIKKKFGKNAIIKGMSLEDGATGIERNKQIGGHKA